MKNIVWACFLIMTWFSTACQREAAKSPRHLCTLKGSEYIADSLLGDYTLLWDKKSLRVFFCDDDGAVSDRVLTIANKWSPHSGVRFVRTISRADSDIRVSFRTKGWWSYVGKSAAGVGKDSVTLSLQRLSEYPAWQFKSVVLHEFGHALGLLHEHQHPGMGIKWKTDTLYRYYERVYGWEKRIVDEEVIAQYTGSNIVYCEPDTESIMIYAIPPGLTEDNFVVDEPLDLSTLDKKYIARMYEGEKCD